MIPSPKLDDREFDDLVAEALRLIPRYAPEWTHHNPADPGITLIELAAWMTDLILYRVNKVPEKNYIAFLNLLGIKLKPPQAARGLLQFLLVEGATRQVVPAGIQVSTPQGSDEDTISFETARDLVVTAIPLDRCFSYFSGRYSDNTPHLALDQKRRQRDRRGGCAAGFEVFGGAERVDRFLYLTDPRFAGCGESSVLRIYLGCPERGGRDLARLLEWQYWSGDRWRDLIPAPLEVDRGEICFFGPLSFEPTTVAEIEGLWMRGRLAEVTRPEDTEIDTIRARVEVSGEGVPPDRALVNLDTDAFIYLDLGKNIYPLGKEPKVDCIFYLACDDLLRTPDAEIAIDVTLADPAVVRQPNPSEDLVLSWEYYDGRRWRVLGRSGPTGVRPGGAEDAAFHDTTAAFTRTGVVTFRRPKDMEPIEISERDVALDPRPPRDRRLRPGRQLHPRQRPLGVPRRPPAAPARAARHQPALARGVPRRPPRAGLQRLHLHRRHRGRRAPSTRSSSRSRPRRTSRRRSTWAGPASWATRPTRSTSTWPRTWVRPRCRRTAPRWPRRSSCATRPSAWPRGTASSAWCGSTRARAAGSPLSVADGTAAFTTSGFVDFVAPDDWAQGRRFTEERFWLRARLEMGGFAKPPRVLRVLTNVVDAYHHSTIRGEILGSSDGTPLQSYALLQTPLLEGEAIAVREAQIPPPDELRDLAEDAVQPIGEEQTDCWVVWRRVESFFESGPRSRHYTHRLPERPRHLRRRPARHDPARGPQQHRRARLPGRRRRRRQRQPRARSPRCRARSPTSTRSPTRSRPAAAPIARRWPRPRSARPTPSRAATARSPPRTSRCWPCARRPRWPARAACPTAGSAAASPSWWCPRRRPAPRTCRAGWSRPTRSCAT